MNGTGVTEEIAAPALAAGTSVGGPHIGLIVRDPSAAAEWWCRTLGFEPVVLAVRAGRIGPLGTGRDPDPPQATVRHPDSGLAIGFRRAQSGSPSGGPPPGGRARHGTQVSLRVASHQALDDWAARLDELGVAHSPVRDNGVELFLSLYAPDDIELELWWPRPAG